METLQGGECLNLENNLQWGFNNSFILYNYLIYTSFFFFLPSWKLCSCVVLAVYLHVILDAVNVYLLYYRHEYSLRWTTRLTISRKFQGQQGQCSGERPLHLYFREPPTSTKIGPQKLPTSETPRHPFAILEFKVIILNQIIYYIKSIFF